MARAIHTLGGQVTCFGFLAGHTGRLIDQLLSAMDIPARWIWVEGESRIAVAIVDPQQTGVDATLISEAGPPVTRIDWDRLIQDILSVNGSQHACLCGSMPSGTPLDMVVNLIESLENNGTQVWVDTSGKALKAAVQARPSGIKINQVEAQELTGMPVTGIQQALLVADILLGQGIRCVSITLGNQGAVLCQADEAWLGKAPETRRLSSVGSGDAFLGGLLWGYEEGLAPAGALRAAIAAGTANTLSMGGGRFSRQDFELWIPRVMIERIK